MSYTGNAMKPIRTNKSIKTNLIICLNASGFNVILFKTLSNITKLIQLFFFIWHVPRQSNNYTFTLRFFFKPFDFDLFGVKL